MFFRFLHNPITRKRFLRFKEMKRAYLSFWILLIFYVLSLFSEFLCSNTPIYVRFNGESFFPVVKFYSEDTFVENGKKTRPDYKKLLQHPNFDRHPENFMIFPIIPYGPYESVDPASIAVSDEITISLNSIPMVGTANIDQKYVIHRSAAFSPFVGKKEEEVKGLSITDHFNISEELKKAIEKRFANKPSHRTSFAAKGAGGMEVEISLSTFSPRTRPPKTVRLTFREYRPKEEATGSGGIRYVFNRKLEPLHKKFAKTNGDIWTDISKPDRIKLLDDVRKAFSGSVDSRTLLIKGRRYAVSFIKEEVRFPFAPAKGHLMGIDGAGRDVLARILYGLRTSLTFGLLLVFCSMAIGVIAGAFQGYFGGVIDITGQRLIEIWSALPFLYIMILMGSVYGRSFSLLLFCYGIFNWIGISYFIRAEFLRLRKQAFVETAICMGISPFKIIFKHILPNAMVPVITFFPFSLVGAIGALAALDYLGFGLPPPTPSWGELLFQAQQYRWAWWLILYPSLALFIVMLLGVFIGEGIRNAYDPKRFTRLE